MQARIKRREIDIRRAPVTVCQHRCADLIERFKTKIDNRRCRRTVGLLEGAEEILQMMCDFRDFAYAHAAGGTCTVGLKAPTPEGSNGPPRGRSYFRTC